VNAFRAPMEWEGLRLYQDPDKCAFRAFVHGDHVGHISYGNYITGVKRLYQPRRRVTEDEAAR
jgi:hypothetical protein